MDRLIRKVTGPRFAVEAAAAAVDEATKGHHAWADFFGDSHVAPENFLVDRCDNDPLSGPVAHDWLEQRTHSEGCAPRSETLGVNGVKFGGT